VGKTAIYVNFFVMLLANNKFLKAAKVLQSYSKK